MILIDSREKAHAIQKIIDCFQQHENEYDISKLYIGDYIEYSHPNTIIDRKRNIQELAMDCTKDHDRFKRELERLVKTKSFMIILVEQNTYKDRGKTVKVDSIEDLILWEPKYGQICGEQIYRIIASWVSKYPIEVRFCNKRSTGKQILEILGGENDKCKRSKRATENS